MAEASAAFWHWLRATAIMPMSMASGSKPSKATQQSATSGNTVPRRPVGAARYLMSVRLAVHHRFLRQVELAAQEQHDGRDRDVIAVDLHADVLSKLRAARRPQV